jgi:hypothetical protein
MSSLSPTHLALRGAGLGPAGWPTAPTLAATDSAAGRQAAAWFNEPLVGGSQVLRAPVQAAMGDAQALCQRFLGCLVPDSA